MMKLANISSLYRSKLMSGAYQNWLKKGQRVLDVGCGTGVVSQSLAQKFKLQISGCDIENYLICNIPFEKQKSADKLPFKSSSFDVVVFNDVLHHTPFGNQKKIIKEALRVANEVLIFEVKPKLLSKISDYIINKIHYWSLDIPFTFRTVDQWQNLFKNLNVKVQKIDVKRPLLYPFSHIAFRLFRE